MLLQLLSCDAGDIGVPLLLSEDAVLALSEDVGFVDVICGDFETAVLVLSSGEFVCFDTVVLVLFDDAAAFETARFTGVTLLFLVLLCCFAVLEASWCVLGAASDLEVSEVLLSMSVSAVPTEAGAIADGHCFASGVSDVLAFLVLGRAFELAVVLVAWK